MAFRAYTNNNIPPYDEAIKVKHVTDLCRQALVGTQSTRKLGPNEAMKELRNAIKLRKSGVKFKASNSNKYLVDVKVEKRKRRMPFSNQVELQILPIYVEDNTESLIRNVMALEQLNYPSATYICGYIELMDFLIENEEDVDYLVSKEIVSNHVGSNAVIVDMFNELCRKIPSSISYYSDICNDLKEHYDQRWNHLMANMRGVYFSNPWTTTATIAEAILLLLTFLQTVFSIFKNSCLNKAI